MTTAYERWQNKVNPYDNEIEIKMKDKNLGDVCYIDGCKNKSKREYGVGCVQDQGRGVTIMLCKDHDSDETAFEVYQDMRNREER